MHPFPGKTMKDKLKTTIDYLKSRGVNYGDIRYVRAETESIHLTDETVDTLSKDIDQGFGIRVIADGAWGFASSSICTAAEMRKVAHRAINIARASAMTKKADVRLAEAKPQSGTYATPFDSDPFKVRLKPKIDLLLQVNKILKKDKRIKVAESSMGFFRMHQVFCSTEGAEIEQDILQSGAGYTATAVEGSEVQKRSYPNSHGGDFGTGGYEIVERMNLLDHAERVREEAIALLSAPPLPAGRRDIVIGGSQMALQVHESCGHPTELDRVLGTEISLAGGSFLQLDKLNQLQYGSRIVTIVADATVPGGLGTFGYDDEGIPARRDLLVREGLFVGYQTSRETALAVGRTSSGAMRADGWNRLPLIRMTNINLEPGSAEFDDLLADTDGGLLLETNKSWSIDDQRLNFMFGVEIAWDIKNGQKGQIYKNPLYTGITPEFWNSCDAICNEKYWHVWGVPNCGKGEPMQTARVAHGTAPARFRNIEVGVTK